MTQVTDQAAATGNESRAPLFPLILLASASGARTWAGIAALEPRSIVPVFAAGELVLDKLPRMPPRVDGPSIVGRIAAGAVIGAIFGLRTRGDRVTLAIVGGLTSFLSAHATYRMRRELTKHLPPFGAAIIEDVAVIAAATVGATLLREHT